MESPLLMRSHYGIRIDRAIARLKEPRLQVSKMQALDAGFDKGAEQGWRRLLPLH
jgi:hypothetical protein